MTSRDGGAHMTRRSSLSHVPCQRVNSMHGMRRHYLDNMTWDQRWSMNRGREKGGGVQ